MGICSLHARNWWAIVGRSTVHLTPLNFHLRSGFALWECSLSEKWCIVMCFYAFSAALWGSTPVSTLHQRTLFVWLTSICIPFDITCILDPSRTFRLLLLRKPFFSLFAGFLGIFHFESYFDKMEPRVERPFAEIIRFRDQFDCVSMIKLACCLIGCVTNMYIYIEKKHT